MLRSAVDMWAVSAASCIRQKQTQPSGLAAVWARERFGAPPNVPEERSSSPKAFQSVPGAICHAAKSPKSPFLPTLCPSERPGQPVKDAYRGLTNRSAYSPFCRSCKDVALGKKDPRAVREAGADRGGRNLAGEDDEDDEAESVDDDEASSSAAIAEERVGGEPHVPPAATSTSTEHTVRRASPT